MDKQILKQLNTLRKRTLVILIAIYILEFLVVYGLILLMGLIDNGINYLEFILILSIAMFASTYHFINPIILRKYRTTYKYKVIPYIMNEFGESFEYNDEKGLSITEIEKLNLFDILHFKTEDLLTGSLLGINYKCADLKITGSGKNNQQFYGRWYIFDFNKHFKGITHLIEQNSWDFVGEHSSFRKPLGDSITDTKRIKLENVDFNKMFKVYTNNEHYALYILTPHFIEKIITLEKNHFGRLFLSFYKNKVHIGIHNAKDYFEPSLSDEITNDSFKQHLEDLKTIKELIADLKLNIKLFCD